MHHRLSGQAALLRDLKAYYAAHGRGHLPWRSTRDPYCILVSELMLQQTQVERVIPFYAEFTRRFPDARSLASAKLSEVLTAWQGLGYNRRAKYLHEAAKVLAQEKFVGQKLPGVGPYTRGAVMAFTFNRPEVFIETNIRTVFFHYVGGNRTMSDAQLLPMVAEALKRSRMEPRDFYAALMDYGSHLKRQGVKLNARSKHYVKQGKFEGSARQLRGALLRELLKRPATAAALAKKFSPARGKGEVERELKRLAAEGMLTHRGRLLHIPE